MIKARSFKRDERVTRKYGFRMNSNGRKLHSIAIWIDGSRDLRSRSRSTRLRSTGGGNGDSDERGIVLFNLFNLVAASELQVEISELPNSQPTTEHPSEWTKVSSSLTAHRVQHRIGNCETNVRPNGQSVITEAGDSRLYTGHYHR